MPKTKILSQILQHKEETIPEQKSVEELGQQHAAKKNQDQNKTERSYSFAHSRFMFLRGIGMSSPVNSAYNLVSIVRPKKSEMYIGLIPVYRFKHSPGIS